MPRLAFAALALLAAAPALAQTPPPMAGTEGAAVSVAGVVSRGVECPLVRTEDGQVYSLLGGAGRELAPGARVRVEGTTAAMSTCQQGVALNVTSVTPEESAE